VGASIGTRAPWRAPGERAGRLRPPARGHAGQAIVELALALPLLLALLCGVLEFGLVAADAITLADAAAAGARAGAAPGLTPAQAETDAATAVQAAEASLIRCRPSAPGAQYLGSAPPYELRVTASCAYAPLTPLGAALLGATTPGGTLPLARSVTWRVMQ
jgi:Flp pilus assembly protein TadG